MSIDKAKNSALQPAPREFYELLRDAWLMPQRGATPDESLRSRVHGFFEGAQTTFDRKKYAGILEEALGGFVERSFFHRFPGQFDLCAVEYRSLAPRIAGETPFPESLLFLLGAASVSPQEIQDVDKVMRAAYGRELTYLSLIPEEIEWLQVVYHDAGALPKLAPVLRTIDLSVQDELQWLTKEYGKEKYGKEWYEVYVEERAQRGIKEEIRNRLTEKVSKSLKAGIPGLLDVEASPEKRERLTDMVASTAFMTLARITQTGASLRSILYLPARLHSERLGGAVLMGPSRIESHDQLDALYITLQILLSHLRLAEFPEEVRLAERDVLLRQFVRRFRHNMMHPLGNLMDSARRFKDSFQQILVTFERGIDAWKPDLMPNPVKTFLNYLADEYRAEENLPTIEGAGEQEPDEDLFPIDVKGTDRIEHLDRSILAEVFRNLMTNTRRYALGKGLERVEIDVGDSGPLITYREKGGPGLPPEIAANPWRLHARDQSEAESSGQGLFLARKLMEIHGGDISYEQDAQGGCKFKVCLRKEGCENDGQTHENHDRG
ncbi:MAG: ATP-binding protein [Acidobacteriota bacterium]